jgi:flagellar basal-body rod protein FlgC
MATRKNKVACQKGRQGHMMISEALKTLRCGISPSFAYRRISIKKRPPMISGIHSARSGLNAIQKKMEATANNVANLNTDGFKKTRVTLHAQETQGVQVMAQQAQTPGPMVYEPTSGGEILVEKSNVELSEELPEMMLGRRFFQANLKIVQVVDEMLGSLLDIKS